MNVATFFISTGRCATQWIAEVLGRVYPDLIVAEHEPLHHRYESRKTLAHSRLAPLPDALSPVVLAHFRTIEQHLETRSYVECGHPNWSTIPYMAEAFRGRVRFVHLTRHPVPTAYSWLTHTAFQPPFLPHLSEKVLLSPFDEGVKFQDYRLIWERLSPFEKCLYYWLEVNAFALDFQERTAGSWLRIRYEDLFNGDALQDLLSFLELPRREQAFMHKQTPVDQYRYLSPIWQEWNIIEKHPEVMRIADQLGYDFSLIDETALFGRYCEGR